MTGRRGENKEKTVEMTQKNFEKGIAGRKNFL